MQQLIMRLLQGPFYLRGVVVIEGDLVAHAEDVRLPRKPAGALEVGRGLKMPCVLAFSRTARRPSGVLGLRLRRLATSLELKSVPSSA